MPIYLKANISRNERNKTKKYREIFGYNIPKNYREALLLDKNNGNNLWAEKIAKGMTEL